MDKDSYIKGSMSSLMWGIYGDKRKGVCIELDFEKIKFPKHALKGIVHYKRFVPGIVNLETSLRSIDDVDKFIIAHKKELMFTKTVDWAGEKEYRVLSRYNDFLDISEAIKAIVVTDYNLPFFKDLVALIGNKIPIKLLGYNTGNGNIAVPVISDAIRRKEQDRKAQKNKDNILNRIGKESVKYYKFLEENPSADLTKVKYRSR